ncbi:transposase [Aliikangiella marina]|uniref:Transposase n=1 Tax=Aliikangiella marina TaxID=1712262 RepID=A0A545TCJ1_9GAMM|nr:transposase [Aliikangiella marina]TQV74911.1 transposase [Aliikangiella marina]
MATKRSELIDPESAGYYHLISRCVRRAFLCGKDEETGKSYEHRRAWIENRILELANIFAIEVYSYAVMHNHYHFVIYSDPQGPNQWTDFEVADRWLKLFSGKLDNPRFKLQRTLRLQAIIQDRQLIEEYRYRLGSVSWLMKCLNEPIAKRCNLEDFVKGHFWESRFTSQALLDEAAALTCMTYVDLNPIRAGVTDELQSSEFTSIQKRVAQLNVDQLEQAVDAIAGKIKSRTMNLKLKDYIELVEWTGKNINHPGKATMPHGVLLTVSGLNLSEDNWLQQLISLEKNYHRAIGPMQLITAYLKRFKKHWIKGISSIRTLYIEPT